MRINKVGYRRERTHRSVAKVLAAGGAELGLVARGEGVYERLEDGVAVLPRRHRGEVRHAVAILVAADLALDGQGRAGGDELVDHGDGLRHVLRVVVVARKQHERRLVEHVARVDVGVPFASSLSTSSMLRSAAALCIGVEPRRKCSSFMGGPTLSGYLMSMNGFFSSAMADV